MYIQTPSFAGLASIGRISCSTEKHIKVNEGLVMGRFKKEVNRRTSGEHRDAGEGDQAR